MRESVCLGALLLSLCTTLPGQESPYAPQGEQIPGPLTKADREDWWREIKQWRAEQRVRAGLDPTLYNRDDLRWAQTSFIQPQSMVEDRYFYCPVRRAYSVDRFLLDLDKRYGGIDSVLLWPVYPNIGIDNRNQFDMLRDMPGGLPGLRNMIEQFHSHRVRVLFPTMPWDVGTRSEPESMSVAIAKLMAEIGADGVNGDTFTSIPRSYRQASDATRHPVVFEPENGASDEALNWNHMSWGYWKYPFTPMISRYKWLESRHMVNVCDRWSRDKTDNLQAAFFNGVGYESWENVWGIWNGITERDAEALRRIAIIERFAAPLLTTPEWEPHVPTVQFGVFASRFPGAARTLWTFVNRGEMEVQGEQLAIPVLPGMRYFDLWHGKELTPSVHARGVSLTFSIEAHGFGAVLMQPSAPDVEFAGMLSRMRALSARSLASFSHEWHFLSQQLVPIEPTAIAAQAPDGMVRIPPGHFEFDVEGVEIEGSEDIGVDVQYPWENSPRRHHHHAMDLSAFFIDRYPVSNEQFQLFLRASHYHPADDHNFLRDWKGSKIPNGWEKKPVTWVALEDARAYAKWAGKRLPHEWEWQYAAQGTDARRYPWGNEWRADAAPPHSTGHELPAPAAVDEHAPGASPFGVEDLTGNVWQWTDEFIDEHTRAAALRGGSQYRPSGSHWYFPRAEELSKHGKYLLIAPSKDRAGTLGFRCVKDAA